MVITRDKLQKMYEQNLKKIKEEILKNYVTYIKEAVIRLNNNGDTKYTYVFYKEKRAIIQEVARRLQEIFIDCEILVDKESNDFTDKLFIDWTNN